MTETPAPEDRRRERFRTLPEPVLPADWVETVDTGTPAPLDTEQDERARLLREAGGGTP
jgi:hypothetical protein